MDPGKSSWPLVNRIPVLQDIDDHSRKSNSIEALDDGTIDSAFHAAVDATEEAIYNALCSAETMEGRKERKVEALPLERVNRLMENYL
jgi:D-aminopeptidase